MSRPAVPQTTHEEPRILLVVPETDWALALSQALDRSGFESRAILSAESVSLATGTRRPAAVVIDASFLAGDGYRLMETVRLSVPNTPILVVAEASDAEMRSRALLMGADDCLIHPFTEREGVLRIRRAVERGEGLRRLAHENEVARSRVTVVEKEASAYRTRLLRHLALMERGTDFHLRLDPDRGPSLLIRDALRHLEVQTGVDRLMFLGPAEPDARWFTSLGACGIPASLEHRLRLPARSRLVSLLASGGGPAVLDRLSSVPGLGLELGLLASGGFAAAAPVLSAGSLLGIVVFGEVRGGGAPGSDLLAETQFVLTALGPALAAVGRREHETRIQSHALAALVTRVEAAHPGLQGHGVRVAALAEDLGAAVGFRGLELTYLHVAGLIHDLGRHEIESTAWNLAGPLSDADRALVQRHPEESERLAAEASWPDPVLRAIRHHHERWDGSGYPNGLRGEAIPLEARILAVADAFEAMTSSRPHRPAIPPEQALARIRGGAGVLFDPVLAVSFSRLRTTRRSA